MNGLPGQGLAEVLITEGSAQHNIEGPLLAAQERAGLEQVGDVPDSAVDLLLDADSGCVVRALDGGFPNAKLRAGIDEVGRLGRTTGDAPKLGDDRGPVDDTSRANIPPLGDKQPGDVLLNLGVPLVAERVA